MKQATHAWIAIRAAALIGDDPETAGLFSILRPHIRNAALGAWMPDLADTKLGSGDIDNHVFKMGPYMGHVEERFVTPKAELLASLGPARAVTGFLEDDASLGKVWWGTPFKAEPLPCQDIPTRANALSTQVTPDERTRAEQLALFFFMQSHFIADACMPCHCDARPVAAYAAKLHPQWEGMMERAVPEFGREHLGRRVHGSRSTVDGLMEQAREVDARFGISFPTGIPAPRTVDPWKDTVAVCRGSFALNSIIASPRQFPYTSQTASLSLADIKTDPAEWARFERATAAIVHDAVMNVAMGWKRIWGRFTVDGARCTAKKGASA